MWYRRRLTGANGIVYGDRARRAYILYNLATGSRVLMHAAGAFSPDGSEFATIGLQRPDSNGVVFTQSVDDVSGATRFQVTRYAPPSTATASQRNDVFLQSRFTGPTITKRFSPSGAKADG